jgi:hypothetical protein
VEDDQHSAAERRKRRNGQEGEDAAFFSILDVVHNPKQQDSDRYAKVDQAPSQVRGGWSHTQFTKQLRCQLRPALDGQPDRLLRLLLLALIQPESQGEKKAGRR